jgi:hypothetical protein
VVLEVGEQAQGAIKTELPGLQELQPAQVQVAVQVAVAPVAAVAILPDVASMPRQAVMVALVQQV